MKGCPRDQSFCGAVVVCDKRSGRDQIHRLPMLMPAMARNTGHWWSSTYSISPAHISMLIVALTLALRWMILPLRQLLRIGPNKRWFSSRALRRGELLENHVRGGRRSGEGDSKGEGGDHRRAPNGEGVERRALAVAGSASGVSPMGERARGAANGGATHAPDRYGGAWLLTHG